MPQGWDFGALENAHMAYQIDRDDKHNIIQVAFLP